MSQRLTWKGRRPCLTLAANSAPSLDRPWKTTTADSGISATVVLTCKDRPRSHGNSADYVDILTR